MPRGASQYRNLDGGGPISAKAPAGAVDLKVDNCNNSGGPPSRYAPAGRPGRSCCWRGPRDNAAAPVVDRGSGKADRSAGRSPHRAGRRTGC
jgi:hypothetical protein